MLILLTDIDHVALVAGMGGQDDVDQHPGGHLRQRVSMISGGGVGFQIHNCIRAYPITSSRLGRVGPSARSCYSPLLSYFLP